MLPTLATAGPERADRLGDGVASPVPALATAPSRWWSLDDDLAPTVAALLAARQPFALATAVTADGGPRRVGAQMILAADQSWGSLSGGCLEADLAWHARLALVDGRPRRLVYGRGSPWPDIQLACGARLEVLLEPMRPGDPAMAAWTRLARERALARYVSDGVRRWCGPAEALIAEAWPVDVLLAPRQRLLVLGSDPFAHAIAEAGWHQGWDVQSIPAARTMADLGGWVPDLWTAAAVATHDEERDHEALAVLLPSRAGFVGLLGARSRIERRRRGLRAAGLTEEQLGRLRAPIGLPLGGRSPREVAVAVVAEVIRERAWTSP